MTNENQKEHILQCIRDVAKSVATALVEREMGEILSQQDWEDLGKEAAQEIAKTLSDSETFNRILSEGDMYTKDGGLNAHGILKAVERATIRMKGTPHDKMDHLYHHMKHTFEALGVIMPA